MPVCFGIAQRACHGETECGDGYTTHVLDDGALVSVVDGLGHGPKASEAAVAFTGAVGEDLSRSVQTMMDDAHRRLARTRGAAAAILRVDEDARCLHFTGVGNIAMHAVADVRMRPVCAPGIVGRSVRKMLPYTFELPPAALIALCSDGISSDLRLSDYAHLEPQEMADAIMERHGQLHDDATCVIVRYTNEA